MIAPDDPMSLSEAAQTQKRKYVLLEWPDGDWMQVRYEDRHTKLPLELMRKMHIAHLAKITVLEK